MPEAAVVAVGMLEKITGPEKFAGPVKFGVAAVKLVKLPTEVKEELTTDEPNEVEVNTSVLFIFIVFAEAKFKFSLKFQEGVAELSQVIVLSVEPLSVIPPPSAVLLDGLAVDPNSMFLSSTIKVLELTVVVVPFTVKSPVMVNPVTFKLPELDIEVTTSLLEFLNSTKLGVAPPFGYKQCRL